MKRLILTIFLPFLFAGTTGKTQKPETDSFNMDTAMMRRIADRMATAWAKEKVKEIDSALATTVIGRTDEDRRPDGSVYAWIWMYKVIGRDTTYDTTMIKRIQ